MKFDHILVPVDFSPSALEAASTAIDLLRTKGGGKLTFVHVVDAIYYDVGWLSEGVLIPREVVAENKGKIKTRLEQLLTVDKRSGIKVETIVCEGTPYLELVRLAEEKKPDLIVIGTHGRRGAAHLFLGSVAEKVMRMVKCPVLTVKAVGTNDGDLKA